MMNADQKRASIFATHVFADLRQVTKGVQERTIFDLGARHRLDRSLDGEERRRTDPDWTDPHRQRCPCMQGAAKIANNGSVDHLDRCIMSNGGRRMHQEISRESFQAG
jgi:hypothetical protein